MRRWSALVAAGALVATLGGLVRDVSAATPTGATATSTRKVPAPRKAAAVPAAHRATPTTKANGPSKPATVPSAPPAIAGTVAGTLKGLRPDTVAASKTLPTDAGQVPFGMADDGASTVFIADPINHVVRWVKRDSIQTTIQDGQPGSAPEPVVVGNGSSGSEGDGGSGEAAQLQGPYAVATGPGPSSGMYSVVDSVYIADAEANRIRRTTVVVSGYGSKLGATRIDTLAGTGASGFGGDGAVSTGAVLNSPYGVAYDGEDNVLFIADTLNNRIRAVLNPGETENKVPTTIVTVAGDGSARLKDAPVATAGALAQPRGLFYDSSASVLYIADTGNNAVRSLTVTRSGSTITPGPLTTLAGTGQRGFGGDGGNPLLATFDRPTAIGTASGFGLVVADTGNHAVRGIAGGATAPARITTVVGNGTAGLSPDATPISSTQLSAPFGVLGLGGGILIADSGNSLLRVVTKPIQTSSGTSRQIDTVAGNGTQGLVTKPGNEGNITLGTPSAVATAAVVDPQCGSQLKCPPVTLAFVLDTFNNSLELVTMNGGAKLIAGDGQPGRLAAPSCSKPGPVEFDHPMGLVVGQQTANGPQGTNGITLYVADTFNNRVVRVFFPTDAVGTRAGVRTCVVAGTGASGFSGDGGTAKSAQLSFPTGVAVDKAGDLYIADAYNSRVRKVAAPAGPGVQPITGAEVITTVAGTGVIGFAGDGSAAQQALLDLPRGLTVDRELGTVYVSDTFNNRIRAIDPAGTISTDLGDGNPAGGLLNRPWGLFFDGANSTLLIADELNNRVLSQNLAGGSSLNVVLGTGKPGLAGDAGVTTVAEASSPRGVSQSGPNNARILYVADSFNNRVRFIGHPTVSITQPVDYGQQPEGYPPDPANQQTITVTDTSQVPFPILETGGVTESNPEFVHDGDTCTGTILEPGQTCTLLVNFAPQTSDGPANPKISSTLTISDGVDTSSTKFSGTAAATFQIISTTVTSVQCFNKNPSQHTYCQYSVTFTITPAGYPAGTTKTLPLTYSAALTGNNCTGFALHSDTPITVTAAAATTGGPQTTSGVFDFGDPASAPNCPNIGSGMTVTVTSRLPNVKSGSFTEP